MLFDWLRSPRLRVATFNCALSRPHRGMLARELAGDSMAARLTAEIIQRVRPDVLLLNEFDYDRHKRAVRLFQSRYLAQAQNGQKPLAYPFVFSAPVNTGVPSGFDLDGDGVEGPADALGFGRFPGQYGMVLLSRLPLDLGACRTFRRFMWRDMPDARLPMDPVSGAAWYPPEALARQPLSSKSHWDVPVRIGRRRLHILASHPTPPVFDGPEQRNARRNYDEIRFWSDYLGGARYLYDDHGRHGGLSMKEVFVLLGDLNADPEIGGGLPHAATQILEHPRVKPLAAPRSPGAAQMPADQPRRETPEAATADFGRTGRLRVDYVLADRRLTVRGQGVYWPDRDDPQNALLAAPEASDHRMVWMDVGLPRVPIGLFDR